MDERVLQGDDNVPKLSVGWLLSSVCVYSDLSCGRGAAWCVSLSHKTVAMYVYTCVANSQVSGHGS
jgi:hypothetical protein